jgi:hypothetical protein
MMKTPWGEISGGSLREGYPSPYARATGQERNDYERGRWDAIDGNPREEVGNIDYSSGYEDGLADEKSRDREMYGV